MRRIIIVLFFCIVAIDGLCRTEKDKGYACDKPHSMRWYFNEKKFRCMVFTYLGCGGNGNNFASLNDCQRRCLPCLRL
uniref:BPTI/Kunitz inhibitor domain-containing protein n=1 Tax=Romanomermis culicivorax TaxID=13658 RepID=A0A915HPD7_ROMCU